MVSWYKIISNGHKTMGVYSNLSVGGREEG